MQMIKFAYMNGKEITKQYFISLYLDTRRAKDNGNFPVRLRVFTTSPRKQKFYKTKFEFSKKEFQSIWETRMPRKEYEKTRKDMQAILDQADGVAELINPFDFKKFEKKLFNATGAASNVFWQYEQKINDLKMKGRIGTALSYEQSSNSIKKYLSHIKKDKKQEFLLFSEIDKKWLESYESYMVNDKELSISTVGIYLRALRVIFNYAISLRDISPDIYPFGENLYEIPAVRNVKKALSKEQLKLLYNSPPMTPEQERAKDFWFFSYTCNGMNIKDIAKLRYENIIDNRLVFYRTKTVHTKRKKQTPITVYLTEFAKGVIQKYGNQNKSPKSFIFQIITELDTDFEKYHKMQNFTRFINQHLKQLAIANGITNEISSYWARHSFATNAIRSGASMEYVSEALDHSDTKTTKGYFAGFADETKKEFSEALMKF